MEYRTLGRSSLEVSSICLGCMYFGGRTPEDKSIKIIDASIDAGINFIDNANVCSKGVAEEILGKTLHQNGKRDKIVISSKASNPLSK